MAKFYQLEEKSTIYLIVPTGSDIVIKLDNGKSIGIDVYRESIVIVHRYDDRLKFKMG